MKKVLVLVLITVLSISTVVYTNHNNATRMNEWLSNCTITTVYVKQGDTIDDFGYQYKPNWMDIRDYRKLIMNLNDIDTCGLLEGQTLDLYVEQGYYTVRSGNTNITYGDNGTVNDVHDDTIISVTPITD